MSNENNDDEDNRKDLTRIEDLSEFLHVDDNEVDDKFGGFDTLSSGHTSTDLTSGLNLDNLDNAALPDLPPEELPETSDEQEQVESEEEISFTDESNDTFELTDTGESSDTENDFNFQNEADSSEESIFDTNAHEENQEEGQEEGQEENQAENNDFAFSPSEESTDSFENLHEEVEEVLTEETPFSPTPIEDPPMQEKFEEVKNFAQNFSYGQIQGGGNPPFSLVIRNIKYTDEADDILILLREFAIVTDQNNDETAKSLELGSLLVPQISEYCAIVLAHKLRRFDCDIEVGLSDEVHPSKSSNTNPRGLMKKNSLRQNIVESYHKGDDDVDIKEIIVSTTSSLEGHIIKKYVGVQSSFAIVDEEELERLKFVQQSARANSTLENYETEDAKNFTSERAFKDYQNSFELLFTDLCDQLKVKAMKERANALLGLNYQLATLPFEKSIQGKNCYQLTCTATLAVVTAE